jgi:flagellar biogenesis protein FliO
MKRDSSSVGPTRFRSLLALGTVCAAVLPSGPQFRACADEAAGSTAPRTRETSPDQSPQEPPGQFVLPAGEVVHPLAMLPIHFAAPLEPAGTRVAPRGGPTDAGPSPPAPTTTQAAGYASPEEPARPDLASTSSHEPLPLGQPGGPRSAGPHRPGAPRSAQMLWRTGSSVAVVLGLFVLLAWCARRGPWNARRRLPEGVLEILGQVPGPGKQTLQLMRMGNKLLLVAVTAQGLEKLTEIDDPHEVAPLLAACRHDRPGAASAAFRQVLDQLDAQPPAAARVRTRHADDPWEGYRA